MKQWINANQPKYLLNHRVEIAKGDTKMNIWINDELTNINTADELHLSSQKADGTLRNPVTIWMVQVDNDLYVRAVKGTAGLWYRHVTEQHKGRIEAGGVNKDVTFEEVTEEDTNKKIDEAYQSKYKGYGTNIVDSTLTPQARAATLKVMPLK